MMKNIKPIVADADAIKHAADLLRQGRLVAFPTETVYGLGADASNPDAVAGIFKAKGRPADHPLIVHIASIDSLYDWASTVPEAALKLAASVLAGPVGDDIEQKTRSAAGGYRRPANGRFAHARSSCCAGFVKKLWRRRCGAIG